MRFGFAHVSVAAVLIGLLPVGGSAAPPAPQQTSLLRIRGPSSSKGGGSASMNTSGPAGATWAYRQMRSSATTSFRRT